MDKLSIIIPVKENDFLWEALVADLLSFQGDFEIILVGPSFKNTILHGGKVRHHYSVLGRAIQLNEGARVARYPLLWFLHADTKISSDTIMTIFQKHKKNPEALYFFDLNFTNEGPQLMPLNRLGVFIRSRFLKMPFGDQGFFMSKKTFYSLGQFDRLAPYGEDHLLVWKAHQLGVPVLPAKSTILTSPRKYTQKGWLKTTALHLYLTYKQALPEWIKTLFPPKQAAVAIFVKTPGVSSVKSRLASQLGKEKAEEFFRLSLKATEAALAESIRLSRGKLVVYWAVAEESQTHHPLWNSFATIAQHEGDLGDRLHHVYSTLQKKHSAVFLIGADLPHLLSQTILIALEKLESNARYVIGETEDGGFYLFGGKGPIKKETWKSIPYSSEETAQKLLAALGPDHFAFLPKDFDIDFIEDLKKFAQLQKEELLPEQKEILLWAQQELRSRGEFESNN